MFDCEIVHRSGKSHDNADALSRRPCEPCRYCDRVENKDKAYQTNCEDLKSCCHQQSQGSDNIASRVIGAKTFKTLKPYQV